MGFIQCEINSWGCVTGRSLWQPGDPGGPVVCHLLRSEWAALVLSFRLGSSCSWTGPTFIHPGTEWLHLSPCLKRCAHEVESLTPFLVSHAQTNTFSFFLFCGIRQRHQGTVCSELCTALSKNSHHPAGFLRMAARAAAPPPSLSCSLATLRHQPGGTEPVSLELGAY